MAPNANYSAIERPVEVTEERKPEVSLKLSVVVAVCATMLFFAGRTGSPSEFSHAEVMNIKAFCSEEQFIGKCIDCKTCATYEFANGGCSYFKDTFCTYCEPIKNCPREQVSCTDITDSYCNQCNCPDPASTWGDMEVGMVKDYVDYGRIPEIQLGRATYECYISTGSAEEGGECEACDVCPRGQWQSEACSPEDSTQTECKVCTVCGDHEYVQSPCTYSTDTVCAACNYCGDEDGATTGSFASEACLKGDIFTAGQNAVCETCSTCDDRFWVSGYCDAGIQTNDNSGTGLGSDTQCTKCTLCQGPPDHREWEIEEWDEHVDGMEGYCSKGQRFENDPDESAEPHDTVCHDCQDPEDVADCNEEGVDCEMWVNFPCKPKMPHGAIFKECDECSDYEYRPAECKWLQVERLESESGRSVNAVCKPCVQNFAFLEYPDSSGEYMISGEIHHCPMENHRCDIDGRPFESPFGLDPWTMQKARNHEENDLPHAAFEGDLGSAERRQVISQCAYDHKTCGPDGWCNLEACDDGFVGPQCQYFKTNMACTTDTGAENVHEVIAERTAKKGRKWFDDSPLDVDIYYEGMDNDQRTPKDWLVYCLVQCEENPFCVAFEIEDDGKDFKSSGVWDVTASSTCRMFASLSISAESDPARDCFINHERTDIPTLPEVPEPGCGALEVKTEEGDCQPKCPKEGSDCWCDVLADEHWCDVLGKCIKPDELCTKDPPHPCPYGQAYCFCDGTCGDPLTRPCFRFSTSDMLNHPELDNADYDLLTGMGSDQGGAVLDDSPDLGVITWDELGYGGKFMGGGAGFDCWGVTNTHMDNMCGTMDDRILEIDEALCADLAAQGITGGVHCPQ